MESRIKGIIDKIKGKLNEHSDEIKFSKVNSKIVISPALQLERAIDESIGLRKDEDMGLINTGILDRKDDKKQLSILYFNARSVKPKLDELKILVNDKKPNVIAVVESWLTEDILDSELAIENFDLIRFDRVNDLKIRGGGVIIYIEKNLSFINATSEVINNIDYGWIKIKGIGFETVVIGVFYRPPDCDEEQLSKLIKVLTKFKTPRTVLFGDFNFRDINWRRNTSGRSGKIFLKNVNNLALKQCVKKTTRGDSLLDLVLVYDKTLVHNIEYLAPIGKSDHDTLLIVLNVGFYTPLKSFNNFNYNKANYNTLQDIMSNTDWEMESDRLSVNDYWCMFIKILNDFKENHIPKLKEMSKNETPWLNKAIIRMMKKRDNLFKRFKRTGYSYFRIKYKQIRNKLTKIIKSAKCKYELKIIKRSKNNRKIFYAHVNSKNKKRGGKKIGPLLRRGTVDDDEIVEDDKEVAIMLNEHFCSVFNREIKIENNCSEIKCSVKSDIKEGTILDSILISNEDVEKAIAEFKVNKSPGIDNITSTYALKIKDIVVKPLRLLFNKSIDTNEIPDDWKKSNICPIFKKGSRSLPENYRPISLTTFFGKVMEKIIKKFIENYLESNDLIRDTQHGFRKGKSCLSNLLISQYYIMKLLDEKEVVDIIYLDFQKAFDKVPYTNLMMKVRSLGIRGKLGEWVENWLRNRQQRVTINGVYSEWAEVSSGVPQGSILGPVLFTIYINDIDTDVKNSILKFADDTKMWGRVSSREDRARMHEDLKTLEVWSDVNEMPFNISKCKVLHIGKKNLREIYKLKNKEIDEVVEEKDLGVWVTESMKPALNCDRVRKAANKIIGLINRNIINKTKEGMIILYKTLVRPIIDYCIPFWRPYTKKDIAKLEKVQKRFTRMIAGCKGKNYEQRLELLKLTTLNKRFERADLIQVYKVLNDTRNIYPEGFLTLSDRMGRNNCKKLFKKRNVLELSRNSFTSRVVDIWNALPNEVVLASDVNEFKGRFDKYSRDFRGQN